jgi:DNA-binding TFAR19-related protein (PDSD5 family)
MKIAELLDNRLKAINVGLKDFARDLEDQKVDVVQLDWRPPKPEDQEMKRLLEQLL